jgi:bacterioferritin-associated ferredoxin
MCGIIGGRLDDRFRNNIEKWIIKLKHRGEKQGYGYIHIADGKITTDKCMALNLLVRMVKELPDGDVVIHFRKASIGKVELLNAHPVVSNDKTTIVLHNGTNKAYANFFTASSDSQGLASMLSEFPIDRHKDILNSLGVVFYTKNNRLMFYKDNNRPLVISGDVFASEPLFNGKWANIKNATAPIDITDTFIDSFVTEDDVEVELYNAPARHCTMCKRSHLTVGTKCAVCLVQGKEVVASHKLRVVLHRNVTYKIDSDCTATSINKGYTVVKIKSPTTITLPHQFSIYVASKYYYLHLGDGLYVYIDVIKFCRLNNLPVPMDNLCSKCAGATVQYWNKWNKCFVCNKLTYVH